MRNSPEITVAWMDGRPRRAKSLQAGTVRGRVQQRGFCIHGDALHRRTPSRKYPRYSVGFARSIVWTGSKSRGLYVYSRRCIQPHQKPRPEPEAPLFALLALVSSRQAQFYTYRGITGTAPCVHRVSTIPQARPRPYECARLYQILRNGSEYRGTTRYGYRMSYGDMATRVIWPPVLSSSDSNEWRCLFHCF